MSNLLSEQGATKTEDRSFARTTEQASVRPLPVAPQETVSAETLHHLTRQFTRLIAGEVQAFATASNWRSVANEIIQLASQDPFTASFMAMHCAALSTVGEYCSPEQIELLISRPNWDCNLITVACQQGRGDSFATWTQMENGTFVLNGRKTVACAEKAAAILVEARSASGDTLLFLVESGTPGLSASCSPEGVPGIELCDCRLPKTAVLSLQTAAAQIQIESLLPAVLLTTAAVHCGLAQSLFQSIQQVLARQSGGAAQSIAIALGEARILKDGAQALLDSAVDAFCAGSGSALQGALEARQLSQRCNDRLANLADLIKWRPPAPIGDFLKQTACIDHKWNINKRLLELIGGLSR